MSDHKKHNMSDHQMMEAVFDYTKRSIKVHQDDVSHELTLSASTDSVVAVPTFITVDQGVLQDSRMFKRATIYSLGAYTLLAYPKAGGTPIVIAQASTAAGVIVEIGAAQLQLNGSSEAVMVLQG